MMDDEFKMSNLLTFPKPHIEEGMTLRDYFAGQALLGLLSGDCCGIRDVAKQAYEIADKMCEIRDTSKE